MWQNQSKLGLKITQHVWMCTSSKRIHVHTPLISYWKPNNYKVKSQVMHQLMSALGPKCGRIEVGPALIIDSYSLLPDSSSSTYNGSLKSGHLSFLLFTTYRRCLDRDAALSSIYVSVCYVIHQIDFKVLEVHLISNSWFLFSISVVYVQLSYQNVYPNWGREQHGNLIVGNLIHSFLRPIIADMATETDRHDCSNVACSVYRDCFFFHPSYKITINWFF